MNDLWNRWYNKTPVLFEIVKQLRGRETCFMRGSSDTERAIIVRCLKCHKVVFLKNNFYNWGFFKDKLNVYRSIGLFYGMPMFSYNPVKKKQEQAKFLEESEKYVVGYDLVADFDAHNVSIAKAHNDAKEYKKLLEQYKVPYAVIFSNSGFHFEIEHKFLVEFEPDPLKLCSRIKTLMENFKKFYFLDTLDTGIYGSPRQQWRVAYSCDPKTLRVCYPLNDQQFDNFSLKMVKVQNIGDVKNRGLLTRTYGLDTVRLTRNTTKFLKEAII